LSDDGTALLVGEDGIVRIVRGRTFFPIRGLDGITGGQLSADGRLAVVFDESDARLIDVASAGVVRTLATPGTRAAAISRDGNAVATTDGRHSAQVWEVGTGVRLREVFSRFGRIAAVALSPHGDLVASAETDGVAEVWLVSNGLQIATLTGHGNALTDVDFSQSGQEVVTASRDDTMRVWSVTTNLARAIILGHLQPVTSAKFTAGDSMVVSASTDGTARLWSVARAKLKPLADLGLPVTHVEYARNGRVIRATTSNGLVHVLDASSGRERRTARERQKSLTFAKGSNGATAQARGNLVVLRFRGHKTDLTGHRNKVTSVAFSGDGSFLVTASIDHDARIWDVATGRRYRLLAGHLEPLQDARFSPDGRWVVTAGSKAGIWNASTGDRLMFVRGETKTLTSVTFDPTSRTILTGSLDGTVRTFRCDLCGNLDDLIALAKKRLAATRR
jgi:WD40 repeat protein